MEVERLTAVLEASGLASYRANMAAADRYTASTKDKLGALAEVSRVATDALAHVKVTASQALESEAAVNRIKSSVGGVGRAAMDAADHLERVKLKQAQVSETTVAGDRIDRKLKDITGNANEARRAMESVRLAGAGAGGGRNGVGVGPFGSGFGRLGLLGAGIGAGALAGPALGPGIVGLLGAIPGLAATGAGALGTLMLAFNGVGKAIGGDKKAYDSLTASQQQFVMQVRSLDGFVDHLKQTAAGAMFPGLTEGLHSALSPGTVGAITKALTEFGGAIGQAGAEWGKYFGSPAFVTLFGPLMHAGAQDLTLMSHAALSLFDALGVLGRAAIPLTTWLTTQAEVGSKWLDTWLRAKDATGGLSGAMREAQSSLTLVGNLVTGLWHLVMALGTALYPVSKVAVKDLVDGLNRLAQIIAQNQNGIRDFVNGALSGLVSVIKTLTPLIISLARILGQIADSMGGWKTAFEIVISGYLATKFLSLAGAVKDFKLALLGLSSAEVIAALAPIMLLLSAYKSNPTVKVMQIPGASAQGIELDKSGKLVHVTRTANRGPSATHRVPISVPDAAALLHETVVQLRGQIANALASTAGAATGGGGPNAFTGGAIGGSVYKSMAATAAAQYGVPTDLFLKQINQESGFNPNAVSKAGALGIAQFMPGTAKGYGINPRDPSQALPAAAKMMASLYAKYGDWGLALAAYNAGSGTVDAYLAGKRALPSETVAYVKAITGSSVTGGYGSQPSPYSAPDPFTKNLGPKPKKPPLIPVAMTNAASMYANLAKNLSNTGGQAKKYLDNELIVLTKEDNLLRAKLNSATGRNKDAIEKAMTGVENKMRDVGTLIGNAIVKTGAALLPDKLKAKLKSLAAQGTADADYGAVFVGAAAENYAKTIRDNLLNQSRVLGTEVQNLKGQLANANTKQRAAIKTEIATVTTQLKGVQDQVVQSLQGTVQALQSRVQGYFASVQQEIEAALGAQFFQNGGKTPLEQQLADMQASDQLGSLKDALQAAKDQLANDQSTLAAVIFDAATGSTSYAYNKAQQDQLDLDNKAVTAAQRQLEEYDLSIRAAQERTQVDQDYTVQARKLDEQLSALGDQFANGTGSMAALNDIAAQYGIQLSGTAIPDLDNLSKASKTLVQAMGDLAEYIAKITGKTPAAAPTGPAPGAPDFGSSTGGGSALVDYAQSAQAAAEAMGSAGTYTVSGGSVYYQSNTGTYGSKPMLDEGGWVEKTGVAIVHAGETYSGVGSHRLGGGQMTVELHVHTLDPASVDWDSVAPKVRDAFVRMAKAGAQNPWG